MITYIILAVILYIAYNCFMGKDNAKLAKDTRQKIIRKNLLKSNFEATKALEEMESKYNINK